MRHGLSRWLLLLVITGPLCVYLAGNGAVGLFDRDEPRYAQTSRQMLQSGDWVVPHFLDRIRTAKPVFIYWCQASAMAVLGDTRFAARLPSALGMAATVALLAVAVSRAVGRRRGLWTAFILSSCVMAVVSAKMCLTDAVLLLLITTTQLCLYRLWRRGVDGPTLLVFGLAAGLAGLTKGPVALGINLTTAVALWLLGRFGRPVRGESRWTAEQFPIAAGVIAAVLIAVVTPWLWAIHERAPEFLARTIGHDVIDRIQRGQEGHSAPPGMYSLLVWGTFFPWSLLLPAALVWGWKRRHVPATRFALAAFVGPWVMFELIATKLPHYVLPTYPALAYLVADVLVRVSRGRVQDFSTKAFKLAAGGWAAIVIAIGIAAPVVVFVSKQAHPQVAAGALLITAVATIVAVLVVKRFRADRPQAAAQVMGGGFLAIVVIAYLLLLPNFGPLRLTRDLAGLITQQGGYGQDGVMIDFKEPSLAFEQGGGLREESNNAYLDALPANAPVPTWAVVTRRVWNKTSEAGKAKWDVVGASSGIAYSDRAEKHDVLILRRRDGSAAR